MKTLTRFLKDDSGATAIEYGLIAAGVATVLIAGLTAFSPALQTMFNDIAAALAV